MFVNSFRFALVSSLVVATPLAFSQPAPAPELRPELRKHYSAEENTPPGYNTQAQNSPYAGQPVYVYDRNGRLVQVDPRTLQPIGQAPAAQPLPISQPGTIDQDPYNNAYVGTVVSLRTEERRGGRSSGLGAIAGGLAGGTLGNQIGGRGDGKILTTIIGAIGGGLIGDSIERSQTRGTVYIATIRMHDGNLRTFNYENSPSFRVGDRIDVRSGVITSNSVDQGYNRKQRKQREPQSSDNAYAG
jgi:outer membrane lipoprotein SlyB